MKKLFLRVVKLLRSVFYRPRYGIGVDFGYSGDCAAVTVIKLDTKGNLCVVDGKINPTPEELRELKKKYPGAVYW